jgi:hypothetical protein
MRFWLMGVLLVGCVDESTLGDDGCPKVDLATFACPDGTCVGDLDDCEQITCDGVWCETTEQCLDDVADCPTDTGET